MKVYLTLLLALTWTLACDGQDKADTNLSATPSGVTYVPSDFVTDQDYQKIFVEIDAIGPAAQEIVFTSIRTEVERLAGIGALAKTGGVELVFDDVISTDTIGNTVFSIEDIKALGAEYRSLEPPAEAAGLYILMVDGTYEGDTAEDYAMGFSFGGSGIAVFRDNVKRATDNAQNAASPFVIGITTSSLIIHEFGHILGLVNNGVEMVSAHQDEAYGNHCDDDKCIMHWEADRPRLAQTIGGSAGPDGPKLLTFGPRCIADLTAAASK
jgi:hypothetical protein